MAFLSTGMKDSVNNCENRLLTMALSRLIQEWRRKEEHERAAN
jgi:hypothetical protein